MSRIGRLPVIIPAGVKVALTDSSITVEGPKGKLVQALRPEIKVAHEGNEIIVSRLDDQRESRAYHGMTRQLIHNMVVGVTAGFQKDLAINGVGYKAELKGNLLVLSLGYSTIIEYVIPAGIKMVLDGPNKISISGFDKQKVGQVSAEIRSLRRPEPYKGKGIRYASEHVRHKVGKASAKK